MNPITHIPTPTDSDSDAVVDDSVAETDAAERGACDRRGLARLVDEAGQTSAEYALVLLGAGAVALLILAWATRTDTVGSLLDAVFGQLLDHVKG